MIVSVKYFHSYIVFTILYMLSSQVDITLSYESGQWAVEIKGGPEEAKRLINAHGFSYLGQVSYLKTFYMSINFHCIIITIFIKGPQHNYFN